MRESVWVGEFVARVLSLVNLSAAFVRNVSFDIHVCVREMRDRRRERRRERERERESVCVCVGGWQEF